MLLSRSLAITFGSVLAAMAVDRMFLLSTVIVLIEVLLEPVTVMVLVRGVAIRGKLNGMFVAVAGGAGFGSICVAWQAPAVGVAAAASVAVLHQRRIAATG